MTHRTTRAVTLRCSALLRRASKGDPGLGCNTLVRQLTGRRPSRLAPKRGEHLRMMDHL